MLIENSHIEFIKAEFAKMQSRQDLLNLLNYAKPLIYGKKTIPFELKQLTWYANPKLSRKRYTEFKVKKKSGAERVIHAPVKGLKTIQKTLALILQCVFEPHKAAMGFVRNKSIVDNAKLHTGSRYVYNIDLKDFFPSIDQARVWKCLQLQPFNLTETEDMDRELGRIKTGIRKFVTDHDETIFYKKEDNKTSLIIDKKGNLEKYKKRLTSHIPKPVKQSSDRLLIFFSELDDYEKQVNDVMFTDAKKYINSPENYNQLKRLESSRLKLANLIASLCCTEVEVERLNDKNEWLTELHNVLPQGAPTSPVITNIICQRLDHLLSGVARRFGLKYSRYADDITFSSMHNVYQSESDFIKELHRIIAEQGFCIKESKTRLQKEGYRQEVTGLLVNEKVNVQKRYIRQLRMWLYYWERYGYERAYSFFLKQYIADKRFVKKGKPDITNVISGKLDYLKMVKGEENQLYLKLKDRFNVLIRKNAKINNIEEKINSETTYFNSKENVAYQSQSLHILRKRTHLQEFKLNEVVKDEQKGTKVLAKAGLFDTSRSLSELKRKNKPSAIGNSVVIEDSVKSSQLIFPILHKPKILVGLLKNFSINDSPLKYTTHSWDAGRDAGMFKNINDFLDLAGKRYSKFSFQLKKLSNNLNGKIYNFLFNPNVNEKGWGIHRIKFGWSSPLLVESCSKNESLKPEDFILPEPFQIFNRITKGYETIQKFKQVVDIFKNEIEIRDENSALQNLILEKHDYHLPSFSDPIINNLDNKTFYTDVQWLSKALDLIFENIQKRPQHKEVFYSVINDKEDSLTLEIMQKNSFNGGKSLLDEKLTLSKGDFSEVAQYLQNLCDWSIESDFLEGSYRINYLNSEPDTAPFEKIEKPDGFKYLLTFYK